MAHRTRLRWQAKLPLLLVILSVSPAAVLAYWTFDLVVRASEDATLDALEGLARAKSEAIDQFTEDRTTDVERIAQLVSGEVVSAVDATRPPPSHDSEATPELPELRDAELLAAPDAEARPVTDAAPIEEVSARGEDEVHALRRRLDLILWDQQRFEELLVMDAQGRVIASTFPGHEGRTAAELTYFQNGLRATYVQPVFESPITERLTMVVATPIRGSDADIVGVLAARLNLSRFFRLVNDPTGPSRTQETVVGKVIEDDVVLMAPTRQALDATLDRRVPLGSELGVGIQRAVAGQRGRGRVIDYRGTCVYAAWDVIPSLGWGLVEKIDCEEARGPLEEARSRVAMVAALLLALALLASLLAAGLMVRPLQKLKEATDRMSRGDFDVRLDIPPGDEFGDLADSFERLIAAVKFFRERSPRESDELEPMDDEGASAAPGRATGDDDTRDR